MHTEAQQFSTRLLDQLKAKCYPTSATYLARQIHVTPHAVRLWLNGLNIPKEQNMPALANQGRPMVALVWRNAGGQNCPLKIKGFRKKY